MEEKSLRHRHRAATSLDAEIILGWSASLSLLSLDSVLASQPCLLIF